MLKYLGDAQEGRLERRGEGGLRSDPARSSRCTDRGQLPWPAQTASSRSSWLTTVKELSGPVSKTSLRQLICQVPSPR